MDDSKKLVKRSNQFSKVDWRRGVKYLDKAIADSNGLVDMTCNLLRSVLNKILDLSNEKREEKNVD